MGQTYVCCSFCLTSIWLPSFNLCASLDYNIFVSSSSSHVLLWPGDSTLRNLVQNRFSAQENNNPWAVDWGWDEGLSTGLVLPKEISTTATHQFGWKFHTNRAWHMEDRLTQVPAQVTIQTQWHYYKYNYNSDSDSTLIFHIFSCNVFKTCLTKIDDNLINLLLNWLKGKTRSITTYRIRNSSYL